MTDKNDLHDEDDILALLGAIEVPDSVKSIDNKHYGLTKVPENERIDSSEPKTVTINVDKINPRLSSQTIQDEKGEVLESRKQEIIVKKSIQKTEPVNDTIKIVQEGLPILEAEVVEKKSKTEIKKVRVTSAKSGKNIFSHGIFAIKYCVTSVCIFGLLLLSTNYSAYVNIAKSYIYSDEIAQQSESLLNSVNAGEIFLEDEVIEEEEEVVKKSKQERIEELMKKEEKVIKQEDVLSMKQLVASLNKEDVNLGIKIVPYENRIIIPKIGQNIPLIDVIETKVEGESELNNIFMKELEDGIVRYPGSAKPGEIGNSFIFGHSSNFPWIEGDYNDVFSRLGQLETGDLVVSYYGQKKYSFRIVEKKVIDPDDVSILKRDKNKKELTLMTCWPIGTTLNRLILIGELIEE